MIRAHSILGSKERIARQIHEMKADIVEAIVFVDEADVPVQGDASIFEEMNAHVVRAEDVDYSRESIYGRPEEG